MERKEEARGNFARFIGARKEEVAFVGSESMGMNIIANAIKASVSGTKSDGMKAIANELEFPSSTLPWLNAGFGVDFLKAKKGKILRKDIVEKMRWNTYAVLTSHVQYSNGFKQDLGMLARMVKREGNPNGYSHIRSVVNATQSLGAMRFDLKDHRIDFMSYGAHKWLMAGYEIGALYVRKELIGEIRPTFFSQAGQKKTDQFDNKNIEYSNTASKFELGMPNLPAIFALNAGVDYVSRIGMNRVEKRLLGLTDYLIEELQSLGISITSPLEKKFRSSIVVFGARNGMEIVQRLEKKGINVSQRGEGVRVAPHIYNNEQDIDKLVLELRKMRVRY